MSKVPELREMFDPPDEIIQAGLNGDLVFFIGAGVSMLLKLPSWKELAEKVIEELRKCRFLNYSEIEQLKTLEPKKLLSIAFLIAEDNKYYLDLRKYLTNKSEGSNIYKAINDIGCTCITTNYDELISPRFYLKTKEGSSTVAQVVRICEKEKFYAHLLNEPGTVIHLHGAISKPESMVVTTQQYLEHYDHKNVQAFLYELFNKKTVLFLGYSLDEAEILEHILRKGSTKETKEIKRFALQGFFNSQFPLYKNLYNYYMKSFGVRLLGFKRDYDDYNCLENIIKYWVNQINIRKPPLATDYDFMTEVLGDG